MRNKWKEILQQIKGSTIAVVYIFEGDNEGGMKHFFIWRSNIVSLWINAIEYLHCLPLIMDVRTFVEKSAAHTLPHIDYGEGYIPRGSAASA